MGLKVIFSKQLPNMPKEYICRCAGAPACMCAQRASLGAVLATC